MNRVKELREEQGLSIEELAKLLGISVEEYPKIEDIDARCFFDSDQLEKLAIRLGVPRSYLNGNTNYLSQGEREYRKKLKQMAKSQLDIAEYDFHPSNNLDSGYGVTESVTAQLCIAANLIRVVESIEELSDKVGELNDTIYSYGMWASSQPR